MLIVTNDLVPLAGTTVGASSEETGLPATNLKVLQPSRRWRTTTITNTPYVYALLDGDGAVAAAYDTVAVIGYRGAMSRNRLRNALDFGGGWTQDNTTLTAASVDPPEGLALAPISVEATATNVASLTQSLPAPGTGSDLGSAALAYRTEVLARQNGVDDIDIRVRVGGTNLSTDFAYGDFDLSAGTAGSTSSGGGFTLGGTSITSLGGGWYRCAITYTSNTDSVVQVRFALLDGGSTTIPIGEGLILAAPVTMLQTTSTDLAEYPVTTHDGGGPMFQVRIGWDLPTTETTAARSGWKHCAQRNVLTGFSRLDFYHRFESTRSESDIFVEFADANNENGYNEAGRLIIGKAEDYAGNLAAVSVAAEESGGQQEADGGQIYRPQRRIRRRLELAVSCLTREQAMDGIYRLMRAQGRSRQILVIAEPDDLVYGQEFTLYGFIDQLDPIPRRQVDRWSWNFTLLETP